MTDVIAALGQGKPAKNLEEILSDEGTDVVSIATYDDDHAAQVLACLGAGKHVFVEKPLCRSQAELRAIAAAWRGSGRALACNLILRSCSLYRWLREEIQAGRFGEIYAFDGDYLYGRLSKITEGWRNRVEDYSVTEGGGVHLIDLMIWLTGQRPARVAAVGNRICSRGTAFRYDDFAAATFEFESGMVGRITSNFGCVHRHQHVVRIFGTEATFVYDDAGARVHRSRDPAVPAETVDLSPLPGSKGDLIPSFVESVSSGRNQDGSTVQHELDVMAACIAVDLALAARSPVPIEYP